MLVVPMVCTLAVNSEAELAVLLVYKLGAWTADLTEEMMVEQLEQTLAAVMVDYLDKETASLLAAYQKLVSKPVIFISFKNCKSSFKRRSKAKLSELTKIIKTASDASAVGTNRMVVIDNEAGIRFWNVITRQESRPIGLR